MPRSGISDRSGVLGEPAISGPPTDGIDLVGSEREWYLGQVNCGYPFLHTFIIM